MKACLAMLKLGMDLLRLGRASAAAHPSCKWQLFPHSIIIHLLRRSAGGAAATPSAGTWSRRTPPLPAGRAMCCTRPTSCGSRAPCCTRWVRGKAGTRAKGVVKCGL